MSLQLILQGHEIGGQRTLGLIETLGLATVAGSVTKAAVAPIERLKMLYQCHEELIRHTRLPRPYWNFEHCLTKTIEREGGVLKLWRGTTANIVRYLPSQFAMFSVNKKVKPLLSKQTPEWNGLAHSFVAGGIAGAAALSLFYPLDLIRIRYTLDHKTKIEPQRLYSTVNDVYKNAVRTGGVRGLYKGYCVSLVGIIVYRGCFFSIHDYFKGPLDGLMHEGPGLLKSLILGYAMTNFAGLVSYPLDTLRRRYILTSHNIPPNTSATSCMIRIIKLEGIKAFWVGMSANQVRAVAGAILFAAFDKLGMMNPVLQES